MGVLAVGNQNVRLNPAQKTHESRYRIPIARRVEDFEFATLGNARHQLADSLVDQDYDAPASVEKFIREYELISSCKVI